MKHNKDYIKEEYDELAEAEDQQEKGKSLRVEIPREFIKKYLLPQDIVLDAGAGTGVNAILMAEKCNHVTLLDISPKVLEFAKKNVEASPNANKINLVQGDITNLSEIENEKYSFLVCVGDAISYVLDKRFEAMKELVRVLKKGSILIIGCDSKYGFLREYLSKGNIDEANKILETNLTYCGMGPKTYVYSVKDMTKLLNDNGCEVLEVASTPTFTDVIPRDAKTKYKAEEWDKLKELEMKLCTKPELLGVGSHLLFVAKKL